MTFGGVLCGNCRSPGHPLLSESVLSSAILVSAVGLNCKCSQELGKASQGSFLQEEEKDFRSNSEK